MSDVSQFRPAGEEPLTDRTAVTSGVSQFGAESVSWSELPQTTVPLHLT